MLDRHAPLGSLPTSSPPALEADFLAAARRYPDRVALRALGRRASRATYAELAALVARATSAAAPLARLTPGSVVACQLPDPLQLVALLYACARLGLVLCPLDPRLKPAERRRLLDLAAPAVFVAADAPPVDPALPTTWPISVALAAAEPLAPHHGPGEASVPSPQPAGGERLFYLGFTSGSTGVPRGVLRTQASWALSFRAMSAEFGLGQDERVLLAGSLAHSFFLTGALHALSVGAQALCLEKFSPARLVAAARRWEATALYLVPSMARQLAAHLEAGPPPPARGDAEAREPLPSLQVVIAAGARWLPDERRRLQRHLPRARLLEYYGSSETGFVSLSTPAEFAARPDSVGRPFAGVQIEVRDEQGRPLGPGQEGLVGVRSPLACAALLSPAEAREPRARPALLPGGAGWSAELAWVSAGDRGYLDEAGCLYLVGRADELINVGGLKVFAAEVERQLLAHPAVAEAVVVGLDDPRHGQVVGAVVEPRAGARLAERELSAWLRTRLSAHKLPRRLLVVSRLPRTLNGKPARARARALLAATRRTDQAP